MECLNDGKSTAGILEEEWKKMQALTQVEKMPKRQYLKELDMVNHPSHYTWLKEKCGVEVIDITRHMDFDTGNALKYILRAGHKAEEGMTSKEKAIEDLRKAIFYIEDKIKMLEDGTD